MASKHDLNIVIADDHPVFRYGLRQIIEAEPDLNVVGEAGDGLSALEMIEAQRPAIAILDVTMPGLDGLGVASRLFEKKLPIEVIFVTMHREGKLLARALEAGVKGYVLKDCALTDIVSCIRAVASGQNYASPEMTTQLVNSVRQIGRTGVPEPGLEQLTPTERRILSLLADYKTSKEIANEMFISVRTVDTHRNNICQKLDIHGSHVLMKFALNHKEELR